jgi:hypothetical protein
MLIKEVGEIVPVTVKFPPIVTFPLASFTMLFVLPDGWMTLIVLSVEMAASSYVPEVEAKR